MKNLTLALAFAFAASAQVKLPPFTKSTLPNGATLILLERRELPLVSIAAVIRGGSESDPADKAGLSAIAADLMTRGTMTRTSEQIATELDSLGAAIRVESDEQRVLFVVESLEKHSGKLLQILADVIRNPSFTESEVKKQLAQSIDRARAQKDNPQAAIASYYRSFFFGANHPYSRPLRGDESSIAQIDRDSLIQFHKRMAVGKNLIILAGGHFDAAAMKSELEKNFGSIASGDAFTWNKEPGQPRNSRPRLLLIDKPDATQTYFSIGQPGVKRGHKDDAALELVNTLFGGRFTSILNDELRVNTGLTYGARSVLDRDRLTGAITISSFTKTETTERAIDIALELLRKLNSQGLSEAQLKSAKAYTKGLFPTDRLETTDQVMSVLSEIEVFGLNRGEIDDYFSRLDAVTLDRANDIAKQYYRSDGLVFVLLGHANKIRDAVKKYAPTDFSEVSISTPGYTGWTRKD